MNAKQSHFVSILCGLSSSSGARHLEWSPVNKANRHATLPGCLAIFIHNHSHNGNFALSSRLFSWQFYQTPYLHSVSQISIWFVKPRTFKDTQQNHKYGMNFTYLSGFDTNIEVCVAKSRLYLCSVHSGYCVQTHEPISFLFLWNDFKVDRLSEKCSMKFLVRRLL
jgi:hypothetical protein